jgi:hypothetical protein
MVHQAQAGCGSREKMSLGLPKEPVFTATDWRRVLGGGKKIVQETFREGGFSGSLRDTTVVISFCVCVCGLDRIRHPGFLSGVAKMVRPPAGPSTRTESLSHGAKTFGSSKTARLPAMCHDHAWTIYYNLGQICTEERTGAATYRATLESCVKFWRGDELNGQADLTKSRDFLPGRTPNIVSVPQ